MASVIHFTERAAQALHIGFINGRRPNPRGQNKIRNPMELQMKTFFAALFAAALLVTMQAPAQAQMAGIAMLKGPAAASDIVHKTGSKRRRAGRVAAGVALGVLGVIAASQAHAHRRYEAERHERRCYSWYRKCNRGSEYACFKYESKC